MRTRPNDILNILAVQNDDLMTHTESETTICIGSVEHLNGLGRER